MKTHTLFFCFPLFRPWAI